MRANPRFRPSGQVGPGFPMTSLLWAPTLDRYSLGLDSDPQEVWSTLEDPWLRLKGLGVLSVEISASGTSLVVSGLRRIDRLEPGLRAVVMDAETYQARRGGRVWTFVQTQRYRGPI